MTSHGGKKRVSGRVYVFLYFTLKCINQVRIQTKISLNEHEGGSLVPTVLGNTGGI